MLIRIQVAVDRSIRSSSPPAASRMSSSAPGVVLVAQEQVADPKGEAVQDHRVVAAQDRRGPAGRVERLLQGVPPARAPLAVGGDAAAHVLVQRLRRGDEQNPPAGLREPFRGGALAGAGAAEQQDELAAHGTDPRWVVSFSRLSAAKPLS